MRLRQLLAIALSASIGAGPAWANPEGGVVVAGGADFNRDGSRLTIVNAPGTIINWGSFNIGVGEITRFLQRDGASAVLNRIVGQAPSQILGTLQSNGRVFLVNPNGVVFGAGSQVDVNGLVASSLNITNEDFLVGRMRFDAASATPGNVRNQGAITTPSGGQVFLIAPSVENSGIIASPQGEVVLAAGRQVQLVDSRHPDVHVVVSAPADQALNLGQVISAGGSIGIYGALVNQRGMVNADSAVVGENGRIVFRASDTTLLEAGSVTSARGAGSGGTVHVLGNRAGLTGDARIDASGATGGGTVLVGGDYRGGNPAVPNASATYFGAQSTINADATGSGDGGRVILWSEGATRAHGRISARGGEQSGNGGFAEVSSHGYLDFRALADLRAPHGAAGTLLLDPNDITIQTAGPTDLNPTGGEGDSTFNGGPSSSVLTVSDLQNQLGLGNVVVSTAAGAGPGPHGGRITVADGFGWNNAFSLTLDADNGIVINGAITALANGRLMLVSRGGTITQTAPISVTSLGITSLGDVVLTASNMVANIAARIGDAGNLNRNFTFVNGQSLNVGAVGGVNGIGIETSGAYSPGAPDGVISLRTTSGDITQTVESILSGKAANLEAFNILLDQGNFVGVLSGTLTGGNTFSFTNQAGLTIGSVAGIPGILAGGGNVSLTSQAGDLALAVPVTTAGNVSLSSEGAISGFANGLGVTATAGNGIALHTQTQSFSGTNAGGAAGIAVVNTGPLTVNAVTDNGSGPISIANAGPLIVNGAVSSTGGGAITLASGPTGSVTDTLTINGDIATAAGARVAISTTGPILLRAGDNITLNGSIAANVTQQPLLNLPTLEQCIANPALPGCSSVLPTLATCIASPTTPGCSVVLPTLAQCTANPALAGCSVVLPTLAQCIATPTLAGCSAVLPTLATCIAAPTTAGCSVVLPTLAQCTATPTLAGCSVVLPTLATCIASPTTAGCSVVLPSIATCITAPSTLGCSAVMPTLAQCIATRTRPGCDQVLPTIAQCNAAPTLAGCPVQPPPTIAQCSVTPTLTGCSAILPSIAQCTATPTLAGCSAVLPSVAVCVTAPTTAGCSAILPSIAQCTATPTRAGCSAVLPSVAQCTVAPTLAGCSVVLPSVAQCTSAPTLAGCSAVLPSVAVCVAAPTTAGCSAVLPTLALCTTAPATAGCSVVLPSISACIAAPSSAGCSAVLPSLAVCVSAPTTAGCSVVLPTLAQCTATPTRAGCSAVLPTLASCVAIPTAQGCSAVLPPVSTCVANPTAPGCTAVLPPVTATVGGAIVQTTNTVVDLTNVTRPAVVDGKVVDRKEDKNESKPSDRSEAKNEPPSPKLFCN